MKRVGHPSLLINRRDRQNFSPRFSSSLVFILFYNDRKLLVFHQSEFRFIELHVILVTIQKISLFQTLNVSTLDDKWRYHERILSRETLARVTSSNFVK